MIDGLALVFFSSWEIYFIQVSLIVDCPMSCNWIYLHFSPKMEDRNFYIVSHCMSSYFKSNIIFHHIQFSVFKVE